MSLGLDSLDLELNESKIYITLLAHGPRSVGEIMLETELSSADVEDNINSLKRKGYVYEISGLANRFDAVIPFQDLKKAGEKTIEILFQKLKVPSIS
ncbi:MAG: helix-turn-helix domain-containing protein [Candidatus Hodarchaeales archaeon]|jgi:sugar-specific transcriptional regulator TrmB